MPEMRQQMVSTIKHATESLPPLQKRILDGAEEAGGGWRTCVRLDAPEIPGVYVIFKGRICLYVGQTANLQRRLRGHGYFKDTKVCYLQMTPERRPRLVIENAVANAVKPRFGNYHPLNDFWAVRVIEPSARKKAPVFTEQDAREWLQVHGSVGLFVCVVCRHVWKARSLKGPKQCPACGTRAWKGDK